MKKFKSIAPTVEAFLFKIFNPFHWSLIKLFFNKNSLIFSKINFPDLRARADSPIIMNGLF